MHDLDRFRAVHWILLLAVLTAAVGCGAVDTGLAPVSAAWSWIVAFADGAGGWVSDKAGSFADALLAAWTAFWGSDKVNNVVVEADRPLHGKYDGVLRCKVSWGSNGDQERKNELSVDLDHPRMIRDSAASTSWRLGDDEKARIDALNQQLLQVN